MFCSIYNNLNLVLDKTATEGVGRIGYNIIFHIQRGFTTDSRGWIFEVFSYSHIWFIQNWCFKYGCSHIMPGATSIITAVHNCMGLDIPQLISS